MLELQLHKLNMKWKNKSSYDISSKFNTKVDRSSKLKVNKDAPELNYIIDQMDLAYSYRIFHPININHHIWLYTFFLAGNDTTQSGQVFSLQLT